MLQRKTLRLTTILIGTVCLMLILTAVLVLSLLAGVANKELNALEQSAQQRQADLAAQDIRRYLDDRISLLHDHAQHPAVLRAMIDLDTDMQATIDVVNTFSMIGKKYPMALYDFEGALICASKESQWSGLSTLSSTSVLEGAEHSQVRVVTHHDEWCWLVTVPVRYNNAIEGALAVQIPSAASIKTTGHEQAADYRIQLLRDGKVIKQLGDGQGGTSSQAPVGLAGVSVEIQSGEMAAAKARQAIISRLVPLFVFVTLLACVVWGWIGRQLFTKPILQFQAWAQAVGQGQRLQVAASRFRFREIDRLEESFLQMADAVRDREQSYQNLNEQLEQRVVDRTQALEDAVTVAEQASKSKSEFLANMSHEIRTPMTAILGYSDLLSGDFSSDPKQVEDAIKTIQSNANHLLTIINDILDVSKIEAGQMAVEAIEMNPMQIVEEVASLVRPRARGKGLAIHVQYETAMPRVIRSDPTRLRQILLNLVGNAVKFTAVGSVSIRVQCDPNNSRMTLNVVDSGIGMSEEQCEMISRFEAFTQADASMTRKYGGSGLGLRISNALAHMLGGAITVQSETGKGSTFCVQISTGDLKQVEFVCPEQVDKDAQANLKDQADQGQEQPKQPAKPLEGVSIVLAEDGIDNQRLIKHHLSKAGARVTVCDNGLIALRAIESCEADALPHVLLMDMQMPEMDGYTATSKLREAGYTLPIIALTAHAMDGDRQKCLDTGCDDYLTKPIDKAVLIGTCAQYASEYASSAKSV